MNKTRCVLSSHFDILPDPSDLYHGCPRENLCQCSLSKVLVSFGVDGCSELREFLLGQVVGMHLATVQEGYLTEQ